MTPEHEALLALRKVCFDRCAELLATGANLAPEECEEFDRFMERFQWADLHLRRLERQELIAQESLRDWYSARAVPLYGPPKQSKVRPPKSKHCQIANCQGAPGQNHDFCPAHRGDLKERRAAREQNDREQRQIAKESSTPPVLRWKDWHTSVPLPEPLDLPIRDVDEVPDTPVHILTTELDRVANALVRHGYHVSQRNRSRRYEGFSRG
jgi:hypothetical protein